MVEKLIRFFKKKSNGIANSGKINIDEFTYYNNLQFYTMLKLLLKCGLSDKQLVIFQDIISKNKNIDDKEKIVKILTENDAVVSDQTQKYEDF